MTLHPNPSDLYLAAIIARHRVPESLDSTPHRVRRRLEPLLRQWAGPSLESVTVFGSCAKGTAIRGPSLFPTDVDVDPFLSLNPNTPGPLAGIHPSLQAFLARHLSVITDHRLNNVALRIRFENTSVDLVPARRREASSDHTLWQTRHSTWLQTNIGKQIHFIRSSGLLDEILALKIWTRRHALYFPSFCLELAVIAALSPPSPSRPIAASFLAVLRFLADEFPTATLYDPANSNNVVSALLTPEQKFRISHAAQISLQAPTWPEIL